MASARRRRDTWRLTVEEAFARGSLLADSLTSDLMAGEGSETPDQAARHDADLAAFLHETSALPAAAPSDTIRPTAQRVDDSARATQASLTQLRVASVVDRPGAQQALGYGKPPHHAHSYSFCNCTSNNNNVYTEKLHRETLKTY
jgi:hypothetical protein